MDDWADQVTVVDSPYLSELRGGLRDCMAMFDRVVFVDVCKEGQNPLASIVTQMQHEGTLPVRYSPSPTRTHQLLLLIATTCHPKPSRKRW